MSSEPITTGPASPLERALRQMKAPAQMKIICVDVTNKCDLACSNCTRLLENQDSFWDMSAENFRLALRSLADHPGIIAMIGGNPCMHRDFAELCRIFVEEIPDKARRGLWTNHLFKHEALARDTFGVFNLNPHNSPAGVASLAGIRHLGWYHEGHSEHASLLVAPRDFLDEESLWAKVANCDINQQWSASIVENRGQLRAYFCEVAAAFDLARGEDRGLAVTAGWWRLPLAAFREQVAHFCPGCGVPARVAPFMDSEEIDSYSRSNRDLAEKSTRRKKPRKIIEITALDSAKKTAHAVVDYSSRLRQRPRIAVVTPYYRESAEVLRQCHESVLAQEVEAEVLHFMIGDGAECPPDARRQARHLVLPVSHGDNGNTPRAIGGLLAAAEGADFIAYLDADNWFHPTHLASLLALHLQSGAAVCCAARSFHRLDGTLLPISEAEEDRGRHVDTSGLFLARPAFALNEVWHRMPRPLSPICDRVFLSAIRQGRHSLAYTRQRTVAFRTQYAIHYQLAGLPPPADAKGDTLSEPFRYLGSAEGIRHCLDTLGFWPVFGSA